MVLSEITHFVKVSMALICGKVLLNRGMHFSVHKKSYLGAELNFKTISQGHIVIF